MSTLQTRNIKHDAATATAIALSSDGGVAFPGAVSGTAPASPADGQMWIDTSGASPVAKFYDATGAAWQSFSNGLSGLGGWADVTATTGSPTTGTYTDGNGFSWTYYQWTGAGSVTTTAGLVDALLVSGGSFTSASYDGNGGRTLAGLQQLAATSHTITIGSGGTSSVIYGLGTHLGDIYIGGISPAAGSGSTGTGAGGVYGVSMRRGFYSSITGTQISYGSVQGGPSGSDAPGTAFYGDASYNGIAGVVIIRVPTANALA